MISKEINLRNILLIGSISLLIIIQIIFILHNSQRPDLFGKYSSRLFFIICINIFTIIFLVLAIFNQRISKLLFSFMKNITVSFLTIIVVFILAEIFVRILNPLGINYFLDTKEYFSDMITDESIFYRHKPDITRKYSRANIKFNRYGLRDGEISKDKKNAIRLLLLGDSVTFGWGVNQEEIFPEVLEKMLNQNSLNKIEVINSGVGGYNIYQESQYFLTEGIYFNPDMVMLLFANNDFEIKSVINERNKSHNLIFNSISGVERLFKGTMLAHLIKFKWKYHWFPAQETVVSMPQGSHAVAKYLREISSVCNELRIPFLVFVFQYDLNQYEKQIMNFVKRVGLENGFRVYSTCEFFCNKEIKKLRNSMVDSHPNSNGHKLLADGIYSKIKDIIKIKRYELNDQELKRRSIELKEFRDNFVD